MSELFVLIRGSGDVASAVAHLCFSAGFGVVMHDLPLPTATRRMMSFTDAIFDGKCTLEGVEGWRIDELDLLPPLLKVHRAVLLVTLDIMELIRFLNPPIFVDARMRKHHTPEVQYHLAPLTIGLGPNFIAGVTTHLAVETAWGDELGKVVTDGATKPLEGEPQTIAGHARDRYLYAPQSGIFRTSQSIGNKVQEGETIASINDIPLHAPISGILRGLTHDGVSVERGTKVIEVDPRLEGAQIAGIAFRPKRIAQGVLEAIKIWQAQVEDTCS